MRKSNKEKLPMSKKKKIIIALAAAVVLAAAVFVAYYLVRYTFFNGYRKYLSDYSYEEGRSFESIADTDCKVPGFELVAENEFLKLYTQTSSGYVAVYDKRDGAITYSNPLNADEDEKANKKNKGFLKSAFQLGYYNANVTTGSYDSFSGCVEKGLLKVESIENGVRYLYTIGDYQPENEAAIYFEIPLEYRLDGDSIVVNVPTDHIKEDGAGAVYRIQLLQYFGAAHKSEEGYLVLPNGSGSLIRFNNGKTKYPMYSQYYYDLDPLVSNYTTTENVTPVRLALYGICRENRSILVNVEDGASIASLTAGVSGQYNDYNYAYSTFVLRNNDNLKMFGSSSSDVFVMEEDIYDVNITVRYTFLTEENKGYSGIANYYREKLVNEGVLTRNDKAEAVPFYYDIISGTRETAHVLGVQTDGLLAMTTFEEAEEIAKELASLGIGRQVMNLQGWFNDGYNHDMPNRIKVNLKLGGKKGLEKLKNTLSSLNGVLYGDVAFTKASYSSNFKYKEEASRYYGAGYVAGFGLVNPTTLRNTTGLGYHENMFDIVSPKFLLRYIDKFADKSERCGIDGISLRDLGNYFASDKRRTNVISREEALDVVNAGLNKLESTGKRIMVNEANDFAFNVADDILNAPLEDNNYYIIDERIPLYSMIIHGSIDYSSNLLNYDDAKDITPTLLKLIEAGAAPHYVFTWESSGLLKDTALNRYYCTTFDVWKQEAVESYKFVNDALKDVTDAYIVNHELLSDNLRKITYDNGVCIYINYGDEPETFEGITVEAESYKVEGAR